MEGEEAGCFEPSRNNKLIITSYNRQLSADIEMKNDKIKTSFLSPKWKVCSCIFISMICLKFMFLRVKDQLEKLETDNKIKKMDGRSIKR